MRGIYSLHFDGTQVARIHVSADNNEVCEVWTAPGFRREGLGRRMMKLVCNDADREHSTLRLMVAAGPEGMDNVQLRAWYTRFGFVLQSDCWMIREPRKAK